MEQIYQAYLTNGLDRLEERLDLECRINTLPTFDVQITVILEGKAKQYTYNGDYICPNAASTHYVRQVGIFVQFVQGIIERKEPVRKLSRTDMIFL